MQDYSDLHDIAAESSVIASLIWHPEFINHSDFLTPKMFSQPENMCCYWAIQSLTNKGIQNIDEINLTNQLQSNASVWRIIQKSGFGGIKEFIDNSKYAARDELAEYIELCKTVCTYAYKREVYMFSKELERQCLNENIDIVSLDSGAHEKFSDMTQKFLLQEDMKQISSTVDKNFQEILNRQGSSDVSALPSKFKVFAPYFAYKKTRLIIYEGRQKSCKSMILLNEAIYMAQNGIPTLYVDTEISDEDYANRLLSNISGVEFRRIDLANDLTEEEINKLAKATEEIKRLPLYHYYQTVPDMDKLYSLCCTMKARYGIVALVYDYIKGHEPDMGKLSNTLGQIADTLKNECSGKANLVTISAVQLNRGDDVYGSDQVNMFLNTAIKIALKTPEEIREDGGYEYGRIKAKVILNRDGGMTSDWLSLGADLDRCRIFDCKQPAEKNPFDEE